ncbi:MULTISPECIES: type VI secretion system baseplate subunit TssG [Pseudomonas]|uniref:Type VI secretion protein n=1 Tax=Pseudomonas fluorescens LMG 5329 TaxID=1324332 RepID=A0A0A1Z039_PSEFL|nr:MULTISPECIES: type VI secretion system baseplate subunit TssG [Pseudomonas]KGE66456.1 type VI secretion protein [Pseudomonas fluorescens LMG 5329]NWE00058.1 type VI secretion system baseplate subunit TssG [Pseudomonas sp. IPO3749]NWF20980.1 type VI secretion system baseplate subunit TssG [Pseudomonas sp. IPO3749]
MESQARTASDPVNTLDAMHQEPWEYDFFQALRRIECESPELPRLGHSLRLADDPLRLGQQADCTFAPATLASVDPGGEGKPARLEQFFFGLGGPNGPLPLHITEYVRERQRNNADSTSKQFLDVFHHRLLSLFYRAWAEARPTVSHDRPDDDYWSARLAALSGRGMPSLLNQGLIPDTAKLHYSGHLSAQTRYPDGLKAILSEYFGLPVEIEEYVGQWLELPERSRVNVSANRLGLDFCLGSFVWDRQHKFRIRLGPLTLDDYMGMLPGHPPFNELVAWVAEYLGHELDWDLNLVLQQPEVPALQLNGQFRLGFNTWLGKPEHDANDLILARHYADHATTSRNPEHG